MDTETEIENGNQKPAIDERSRSHQSSLPWLTTARESTTVGSGHKPTNRQV